MANDQIAQIAPPRIMQAFGSWRIAITEAAVGEGGQDDSNFEDFTNNGDHRAAWRDTTPDKIIDHYLNLLVFETKLRNSHVLIFHGWPQVWRRADDHWLGVYSRVRFMPRGTTILPAV